MHKYRAQAAAQVVFVATPEEKSSDSRSGSDHGSRGCGGSSSSSSRRMSRSSRSRRSSSK